MIYALNNKNILELVKQEVSKLAASAVSSDGTLLYDGVNIFRSDVPLVERAISEAVRNITVRFADVCSYEGTKLSFYLPDIPSGNEQAAQDEITRYLILYPVAMWCQDKLVEKAEMYITRASACIERLVILLKTRKKYIPE